jgi:hypothetical protein
MARISAFREHLDNDSVEIDIKSQIHVSNKASGTVHSTNKLSHISSRMRHMGTKSMKRIRSLKSAAGRHVRHFVHKPLFNTYIPQDIRPRSPSRLEAIFAEEKRLAQDPQTTIYDLRDIDKSKMSEDELIEFELMRVIWRTFALGSGEPNMPTISEVDGDYAP